MRGAWVFDGADRMSEGVGENAASLMRKAEHIVGWNEPGNRSFHAEAFEARHIAPLRCLLPDSAPLIRILETDSVKSAVNAYAKADREAIAEQARFKRASRALAWPLYFAGFIGLAAVLVHPRLVAELIGPAIGWNADDLVPLWRIGAPWLVYGALIFAALQRVRFRPTTHFRLWQQARAKAEAMRREVFKRVLEHTDNGGAKSFELLLKLEYFRRWQVELQRDYFKKRGAEHERGIRRAALLNSLSIVIMAALGVVLLLSATAGYDEQGMPGAWLRLPLDVLSRLPFSEAWNWDYWLLLFGFVTAAVLVYYVVLNSANAAKRNAPRFKIMAENFNDLLGGRLRAARREVAAGKEAALRDYADRVHSVMSLEINDWVRLADLDLGRDERFLRAGHDGAGAANAGNPVADAG